MILTSEQRERFYLLRLTHLRYSGAMAEEFLKRQSEGKAGDNQKAQTTLLAHQLDATFKQIVQDVRKILDAS